MSDWSSDVCSSDLVNNPNGEPAGLPVLETWDGAKRYLDDLEFDTNSPFIARPQGMTSDTRAIDLTRRQLLNELDQQVPQYKEARKAFEGPTKDKQAFKLGMEDLLGSRHNTAAIGRASCRERVCQYV